ncbi:MAG TPA: O-methyltransferase [Gemmatimonadaceae bacterium]|nr:O-methyltransferase [Gemmatimonadaceae bacterium]
MSAEKELWAAVDAYINETLVPVDDALDAALKASDAAGLPQISVTPNQGKFLHLLARIRGARNILEVGTLGAYSTIWLARALPRDGKLITIEADPKHADVALANIARAGFADRVELRRGLALDILPTIAADSKGPFDLVFIDADKANIPAYFEWAMKLTTKGSVIIVDNVVRDGAVIDAGSDDPSVLGVRRLNEMLAQDKRVSATTIQTVGSKGYDGFTIALR